ncbi:hypothetical protein K438DRAFT_1748550 [Mycena galopus ATCC 62051]|nr:hypothetical protein K438DRAFT_1748550 [Mycena galopus ATCC 62051]
MLKSVQALISCLGESAGSVGILRFRRSPGAVANLKETLDEYRLSMTSDDLVSAIVKSPGCLKTLLEISSQIGLDDCKLRTALRKDGERIATFLLSIFTSKSAEEAVLRLEPGDSAQSFLDVVHSALDKGFLLARDHSRMARRIIRKLAAACDRVPSSLFITGVTGKEEHPTFGGGFADIYRASYGTQVVALKYMRVVQYMRGSELRGIRVKFFREALVWKELRHPNILPFWGIEKDSFSSPLCMVSPWMEHGTVLSYLKEHGHTKVDKFLYEIAQGLQYLHSCEIVHGDLRGANILVTEDWSACLADFGLSIFCDATSSLTTNRGGSAYWMAPELLDPDRFGLEFVRTPRKRCLYTGRPPFSGQLPETGAMMKVINGERPQRPSSSPPMSDILWQYVSAYWAQESNARPVTRIVAQHMIWPRGPDLSSTSESEHPTGLLVSSDHSFLSAAYWTALNTMTDFDLEDPILQLKMLYRIVVDLEKKIEQDNEGDAEDDDHVLLERNEESERKMPLESLRRASSIISLENLHDFFYYAYTFFTGLFEEPWLNLFKSDWLVALGHLAWYKMDMTAVMVGDTDSGIVLTAEAVSAHYARALPQSTAILVPSAVTTVAHNSPSLSTQSGFAAAELLNLEPEKEFWRCIAREWYGAASTHQPGQGLLHHHLGLLSLGVEQEELCAVYHFCECMTTLDPFVPSHQAILPLWSVTAQARRTLSEARLVDLFVLLHGILFTSTQLDDFERMLARFIERLEIDGERTAVREWIMMAIVNVCAALEYGNPAGVLKKAKNSGIADVSAAKDAAPPMSKTEASTSFHFALQLMLATLSYVLRCPMLGPWTLNPYLTIVMTFLATVLKSPQMRDAMECECTVPWVDIAAFFAHVPHHIKDSQDLTEERTSLEMRRSPLTAKCAPLPEDWCLRGLEWISWRTVYSLLFWRRGEGRTEIEVLHSWAVENAEGRTREGAGAGDDEAVARRWVRIARCAVDMTDTVKDLQGSPVLMSSWWRALVRREPRCHFPVEVVHLHFGLFDDMMVASVSGV